MEINQEKKQSNNKNKLVLSSIAVASVLGVGTLFVLGGASGVSAAAQGDYSKLVENISEKFGLDPEEVETVIEETREERKDERFDTLVEEGKLTQEQSEYIKSHQDEMRETIVSLKESGATRKEIHEATQEKREEFRTWMEEEGLDMRSIGPRGKGGPGMMKGGPRGPQENRPEVETEGTNATNTNNASVELI